MASIAVLGAGRSAGYFIEYFVGLCREQNWKLKIADLNVDHLKHYQENFPLLELVSAELSKEEERETVISGCDWVVSLLPAFMHPDVAKNCLSAGCNLATASYVSDEMKVLGEQAAEKGLVFLNECGLDPGIDHMSAMKIMDELRTKGATITGFQSYCGGLIAPDYLQDNPWKYKFSWNPRNVILAGNGTSTGLKDGTMKVIPYQRNFQFPVKIQLHTGDEYDGYMNRDSLSYQSVYNLENLNTMIRGTLRYPGYCRAWNIFIHLGITDNSYLYPLKAGMTYQEFFHSFLNGNDHNDISASIRNTLGMPEYEQEAIDKIIWTGINSNSLISLKEGSPAAILQELLEQKWKLEKEDKDLVVMQHLINYTLNDEEFTFRSSLSIQGDGSYNTAMSKTVGLPLAMAVKQFLFKTIDLKGIVVPIYPEIYNPVLTELEQYGICFIEETISEPVSESKPE